MRVAADVDGPYGSVAPETVNSVYSCYWMGLETSAKRRTIFLRQQELRELYDP